MSPRRVRWLAASAVVAAVVIVIARPYVAGWSFVVRAADLHGVVRRVADIGLDRTSEHSVEIPTRRGTMRGRAYEPARGPGRTVLLVSGLHPAGIDEPRLVALARDL